MSKMRDIESVLYFRNDISPFLVHLTKSTSAGNARQNLESILQIKRLIAGSKGFSDAKYGCDAKKVLNDSAFERKFFSSVSFTETPLNEIHNLLEIGRRTVNLEPYGLAFLRHQLSMKGVSPVIYLNNINGDKDNLVRVLCNLIQVNPKEAAEILPLIAIFGKKLEPNGGSPTQSNNNIDFSWEREWRFTSDAKTFQFEEEDVFIGLCPDEEINYFESKFRWLKFVDPRRNMKWYAESLIDARKRSDIKFSVV